jgi:hypothetical protein
MSEIERGVEEEVKAACAGTTLKAAQHERAIHLQKWLELPGLHSKWSLVGARYSSLVTAISGGSSGGHRGSLPGFKRTAVPPFLIGQMLFLKGSRRLTPTGRTPTIAASPPFFHHGTFNSLLPFFVELVTNQMQMENPSEDLRKQWMGEIAGYVLKRMRIDFLPWSTGEPAATDQWARWNSFIMLTGAAVPSTPIVHFIDDDSEEEVDVGEGLSAPGPSSGPTTGATLTSAWSPSTLPLLQLPMHIGVHHIPAEVARLHNEATCGTPIVSSCYMWVRESYNKNNKVHHLALIMSWVFTKMAPSYMLVRNSGAHPPAWTSTTNSVRRPYGPGMYSFGWWFIFILSVLDEGSPLRVRMSEVGHGKRRTPFGADWVDFMSEWNIVEFCTNINIILYSAKRDSKWRAG